jgi:hypothetical protein
VALLWLKRIRLLALEAWGVKIAWMTCGVLPEANSTSLQSQQQQQQQQQNLL